MGNGLTAHTAFQIAHVFRDGTLVGMSDREILERFVERNDEMAFEAILTRHGAMVRNVCRQILFDPHDVDDAVQAVFLVLVRKAKVHWNRRIAGAVALLGRRTRRCPRQGESAKAGAAQVFLSWASKKPGAIPRPRMLRKSPVSSTTSSAGFPSLRAPIVLCYLHGLTHDLAARELALPVGTMHSRLARGRELAASTDHTARARTVGRGTRHTAEIQCRGRRFCSPAGVVGRVDYSTTLETVLHDGMGLSASLATIFGGVMNVLKIKKIAVLATVFSAGALAFALAERAKVVGQTPKPILQLGDQLNGDYDPRPLGPDGRRIGASHRGTGSHRIRGSTMWVISLCPSRPTVMEKRPDPTQSNG